MLHNRHYNCTCSCGCFFPPTRPLASLEPSRSTRNALHPTALNPRVTAIIDDYANPKLSSVPCQGSVVTILFVVSTSLLLAEILRVRLRVRCR